MPSSTESIVRERHGAKRIWRCKSNSIEQILHTLEAPGQVIKQSEKSQTRRVGAFVVKESAGSAFLGLLRHTVSRKRYRAGWLAGLHLSDRAIPAVKPVAHVEWSLCGLIWKHATLYEFLDHCVDVEKCIDQIIAGTLSHDAVEQYLRRMAEHVNLLTGSGAIHTDLAGKNILTPDGKTFYFIDLDGVLLGTPYTDDWRLKNLVQLYDSFIDRCSDETLQPFIAAMLPKSARLEDWMGKIRSAQSKRRARTVEKWKQEGKLTD